jgi:twitching motility protein PilI
MPSKDALRELQLRLASRLQAARERPRESGWLAVECGQVGLLLPLAQAGEIHAARQVAPVPHAKPWMVGVANLRGQLNTVIDLGSFLHLRKPVVATSPRNGAQLVMLNPSLRVNAAILVDRLAGLRDPEQLARLPAAEEPRPGFAGASWRDVQGRVWQELDLAALAQDPQFLDVAA